MALRVEKLSQNLTIRFFEKELKPTGYSVFLLLLSSTFKTLIFKKE